MKRIYELSLGVVEGFREPVRLREELLLLPDVDVCFHLHRLLDSEPLLLLLGPRPLLLFRPAVQQSEVYEREELLDLRDFLEVFLLARLAVLFDLLERFSALAARTEAARLAGGTAELGVAEGLFLFVVVVETELAVDPRTLQTALALEVAQETRPD